MNGYVNGLKQLALIFSSILMTLTLCPTTAIAQTTGDIVLKVYLNTEDKGEYFVRMTPDGDMLLRRYDIRAIGILSLPEGEEGYVSLRALAPDVEFRIDEDESALHITADPRMLGKRTLDLSRKARPDVQRISDNAAFLNYGFRYLFEDSSDSYSLQVPWEVGVNVGGKFGFSSFSFRKSGDEESFVRLLSSVTTDDPLQLRRYIIGDFTAFSGMLGSGGIFGGVSVSKNFSIVPYFTRYPGVHLSGFAKTPSDLEVYVDNRLVRKETVSPGEFEIMDIPFTAGSGGTTVIIRDAFGREERIVTPYYTSTRLLKPGLHEYSYNIGFRRNAFGQESFKYRDLIVMGSHRYGFSSKLTAGLRAEIDADTVNTGPSVSLIIGNLGEVETGFAISHERGEYGYGGFFNYNYSGRGISWRLALTGLSERYSNLAIPPDGDKARFTGLVGFGFHHRAIGSLSLTYSTTDNYLRTDVDRTSLHYSRKLFKDATLSISAARTKAEDVTYEVLVNLIYFLGDRTSSSVGYGNREGMTAERVTIQRNPPRGIGWSYRAVAERTEDHEGDRKVGGSALVQYRGPYGIYSASARRANESNSYEVDVSGSMAYLGGSLYHSRPVTDSFALVEVGDLEGVTVFYNNQEVGVTNGKGKVFVPELISYYENKLSIEAKGIPINCELKEIEKTVTTSLRGGGVVKFDIRKLQAYTGRLFFEKDGKTSSADYSLLEIRIKKETIEGIVGKRGEFYLENLPAGRFPARAVLEGKSCSFEITVPETDNVMTDLGNITCELD